MKSQKKIHVKDVLDSGFLANMYLLPKTVNFENIIFREVDSQASGTGMYKGGNNFWHLGGEQSAGVGPWKVMEGYEENKGTKVSGEDLIYGGENEYPVPPPFETGYLEVNIPHEWELKTENSDTHRVPTLIRQSTESDSMGNVITKKNNTSVTFFYQDESSNIDKLGDNTPIPKPYPKP